MTRITVFGSSQMSPGEPDYEAALHLGTLLGGAGFTLLTGGYGGSMEAVSRGAAEAGGHVIGITCEQIEAWRPVKPNAWVKEEHRYPTLRTRLFALIDSCDAALALPGGPGTLAEISIMWNHLLTGSITPRPLILIGAGWQRNFEQFYTSFDAYIPEAQRKWLEFAPDVEIAFQILKTKLSGLEN